MLALILSTALAWQPTPDQEVLLLALSDRDGAPPCTELDALAANPAESLAEIVEHVEMPPWAPMQAAACLIEQHYDAKSALIEGWVTAPDKKGLAKLVFNRLHLVEPSDARILVDKARSGPWSRELRAAMVRSPSSEIRALASAENRAD